VLGTFGAGGRRVQESRGVAPLFTARIDDRYAVIRVRGHLDRLAAEDVVASVQRLYQDGHRGITLEAWSRATVDGEATALLTTLVGWLADRGVLLAIA
jgi:hypothetical protein